MYLVFQGTRQKAPKPQVFQIIPYFFTPSMVIFQTPHHFIKRWWNSNAHQNSHWLHWFWYRSFWYWYWSAISSQLLARTWVSSSSFRRRSHTFTKCLPNRSKISLLQACSKGYFWGTWNQDFAKSSKRIYGNYGKL